MTLLKKESKISSQIIDHLTQNSHVKNQIKTQLAQKHQPFTVTSIMNETLKQEHGTRKEGPTQERSGESPKCKSGCCILFLPKYNFLNLSLNFKATVS